MVTPQIPATPAERDALFAKLFAGMRPTETTQVSLYEMLRPLRRQIIRKRKEGFSLRQIVEALKQEPLKLQVSPATLKRVIGGKAAKRRALIKKLAARRAANLAKAAAAGSPVAPASR
jgi:IS30 family transposase